MTLPELDEFRRRLTLLRDDPVLVDKQDGDALRLADLSLPELSSLLNDETAYSSPGASLTAYGLIQHSAAAR